MNFDSMKNELWKPVSNFLQFSAVPGPLGQGTSAVGGFRSKGKHS